MNINQRLNQLEIKTPPRRNALPFKDLTDTELRQIVALDSSKLAKILDGIILPNVGTPEWPEYDIPKLQQRLGALL
jgi:hypothetical protein